MDIRRFEIIPILDRIQVGDKGSFQITCAEVDNENIILGTIESFIFFYRNALRLGDPVLPKPSYKFLPTRKPILQLKIVSVLGQLLCLTDQTLTVLNLQTFEPVGNLRSRNVFAFCMNESPITQNPFSVEICLVKRRAVQICELEDDKLTLLKEISLPEQILSVSMDGYHICAASAANYFMIDWQNGSHQVVLPNDSSESDAKPMVKHVARDEFLINCLNLGIFMKTSGISDKPPIDWGTDVLNYVHYHPFILCLKRESICIISVIDALVKEEFAISGGIFIDNFDGKILFASRDCVYYLRRIPFQEQIESLLKSARTTEAIELCANLHESGLIPTGNHDYSDITHYQGEEYSRTVTIKAGLIELAAKNFQQAQQYLSDSYFDIRILLNSLPTTIQQYLFYESSDSHTFDSVYLEKAKNAIADEPEAYRDFFVSYLEHLIFVLDDKNSNIHTSLAMLYIEMIGILREIEEDDTETVAKLNNLLQASSHYDIPTVLRTLVERGYDYESAYLYGRQGNHRKAFEIYLIKHRNHRQALSHCIAFRSSPSASKVFGQLFDIYLEQYKTSGPELVLRPFLEFLNHSKCMLDTEEVLRRMPQDWPLIWVKRMIERGVRRVERDKFATSMGKVMATSLLDPKRRAKQALVRKWISIDDDSICINCNRPLAEETVIGQQQHQQEQPFGDDNGSAVRAGRFVWIPSLECCLHESCHRQLMSHPQHPKTSSFSSLSPTAAASSSVTGGASAHH